MLDIFETHHFPPNFSGVARLFPLPNVVLFPHVLQPLRIFEDRYCELLEDAMGDDQLIAMATLQPGWEKQYGNSPDIAATICLGRVIAHTRDDQGNHNILLLGMRRAEIKRELNSDRAYRKAEVDVVNDYYPGHGTSDRARLKHELLACFERLLPAGNKTIEQLGDLASEKLPLGILADIISFTIDIDMPAKQALLTEQNVDVRTSMLLECLHDRLHESHRWEKEFPPRFSLN